MAITIPHITGWFAELQIYLQTEVPDYEQIIQDPRRIWNMDESGFPLSVKKGKALAKQGSRNVYNVTTETHQNITVIAGCNAAGEYLPPHIIFKGERKRNCGMQEFPDAIYSSSKTGWIDSSIFIAFLEEFAKHIKASKIPEPVILFLDGHSSHLTFEAAKFSSEKSILLNCLPAHASHILQPLDVGIFSSLKAEWKKAVSKWHWDNPGLPMTKSQFPGTFKNVWMKSCTVDKPINGFKKTGLYPLDPHAFDKSRITTENTHSSVTTSTGPVLGALPLSGHSSDQLLASYPSGEDVLECSDNRNIHIVSTTPLTCYPQASSPNAHSSTELPMDFSMSGTRSPDLHFDDQAAD